MLDLPNVWLLFSFLLSFQEQLSCKAVLFPLRPFHRCISRMAIRWCPVAFLRRIVDNSMLENDVAHCRRNSYFGITFETDNVVIANVPFILFRAEQDARLNVLYVSIFWRSSCRCVCRQLNKQVYCTLYLMFCETKRTKMNQKEK